MVYLFQGLVAIAEKKWTWSPLTKQVYILITYVLLTPKRKILPGGVLGLDVLWVLTTWKK